MTTPQKPWEEKQEPLLGISIVDERGALWGWPYVSLGYVMTQGSEVQIFIGTAKVIVKINGKALIPTELAELLVEQRCRRIEHSTAAGCLVTVEFEEDSEAPDGD